MTNCRTRATARRFARDSEVKARRRTPNCQALDPFHDASSIVPALLAGPGELLGHWPEIQICPFTIVGHDQIGKQNLPECVTALTSFVSR